jgi:hypothetical protein
MWRQHATKYPILSQLARKILCIPATSAPSERVFSVAGLAICNNRARLGGDIAAAQIFLHDVYLTVRLYESRKRKRENNNNDE